MYQTKFSVRSVLRNLILTTAGGLFLTCCTCKDDPVIQSFAFDELTPPAVGDINHSSGTIGVEVPESTDLTNLVPTIGIDVECQTVTPASGVAQDFSAPVIYEVKNERGDARQYEVSISFSPVTGSIEIDWEERAPTPTTIGWNQAVELNDKIYVISGGIDKNSMSNKMYIYDPETDTWDDSGPAIETGRLAHSLDVVGGKIYLMGGVPSGSSGALSDIQIFDPQTNQWTSGGQMPFGRSAHGSCVIDGKIYIVGGELEEPTENVIADLSVYDPETGTWETLTPMPTPRVYLTAEAVNGKIYAAGGTTAPPWDGSIVLEEYDPETDTWTTRSDMNVGRWALVSCVIDDMIYCFAGTPTPMSPGSTTVQVYSPSDDRWHTGTKLINNRLAPAACAINGEIFVIGGSDVPFPWASTTNDVESGIPAVKL